MKLQKSSERQYQQLKSQKTGEEYSLSNVISDVLFSEDIFLSHEIIRPNSRSSAPHFHTDTNEIIYVLGGSLVAVEGNNEVQVEQGDSIMFERQSGKHHFLKNDSTSQAHVLVIRRKVTASDVVF
ncbi:cupin domain-containing protein [Bdellovibrio sp. HCB185ZH]|uniref:cupin domain-containing protein n=1 Tax=Bdellovibrio sp. HCB185ZH TaxID=3394235 RepID=UPI0039A42BAC